MEEVLDQQIKTQDDEEEIKGLDFNDLPVNQQQTTKTLLDDENFEFQVTNPQLINKHIQYHVKGIDQQGEFQGMRRFNEFYLLYAALTARWPGFYIPKIPPKKAIGNKDMKFILDRRYYLERFLRKLARYKFLIESEEFMVFSRPSGDIETVLKRLPRLTTLTLCDRMRKAVDIDERRFDFADKERFGNNITEFSFFVKKVLNQMKQLKKIVEQSLVTKRQSIGHQKQFVTLLEKYEELNLNQYFDHKADKNVFFKETNQDLVVQIDHVVENLKNPYEEMYHWCKGEIYDLQGLADTLNLRESMVKTQRKLESSKTQTQSDLDNVTAGRKSVRTIFKNQNDTGGMVNKIEITEKEIENMGLLIDIITIYIGDRIIPRFKQDKLKVYQKLMQQFNVIEINNAHQIATFWSGVINDDNVKELTAK